MRHNLAARDNDHSLRTNLSDHSSQSLRRARLSGSKVLDKTGTVARNNCFTGTPAEFDKLTDRAAEYVYAMSQPSRWAAYLALNDRTGSRHRRPWPCDDRAQVPWDQIESNDVHRREPALDRYGEGARAAADIEYPVIRLHGGLLK